MVNSPALAVVDDVDARRFRDVLGLFATGVVAVTAVDAATGRPAGLSANSFTSVSLDPPLVSVCLAHTSTTWPRIRAAGRCAINILAQAKAALGDLERISRCLRLGGFINAAPGFTNLAGVMNGASDFIVEVLGDKGRHARSTIGVAELPLDCAVEIEALLEIAGA